MAVDDEPVVFWDGLTPDPQMEVKENGLIVDYTGVFRNLEQALAIYGAAGVDSPIQDKSELVVDVRAKTC